MLIRIPLLLSLLTVCVFATTSPAQNCCSKCGPRHEEPFFKFLDDFHGKCRPNPYDERIETERHDFTQSTKTVGRGVVQVEAGYTYLYKDENEEIERSHTTPETLLRVGISEDIEFRLRWSYAWRFRDQEDDLDSAQDMQFSVKLGLTEECGCIPESALVLRGTAPTGGSTWTLGRAKMGIDYIGSYQISENWRLYGSSGYSQNGLGDFSLLPEEPENENFAVWSKSVAMGVDLTENSTFYSEWFGLFSDGLPDDFTISVFNVGVDYYLTNNLVVDLRVGTGLNDETDDLLAGVGGGYRF